MQIMFPTYTQYLNLQRLDYFANPKWHIFLRCDPLPLHA
jgi:hypothetical protein